MKLFIYTFLLSTALAMPPAGAFADNTQTQDTGTQNTNNQGTMTEVRLISGDSLDRDAVLSLQEKLSRDGYYQGRIDGIWGPNTLNALNLYEQANSGTTTPDGLVNLNTLTSLGIPLRSAISADGTDGPISGSASGHKNDSGE